MAYGYYLSKEGDQYCVADPSTDPGRRVASLGWVWYRDLDKSGLRELSKLLGLSPAPNSSVDRLIEDIHEVDGNLGLAKDKEPPSHGALVSALKELEKENAALKAAVDKLESALADEKSKSKKSSSSKKKGD